MTPEPSSTYAWEREEDVECVVCPDCAFTFDAFHSDADDRYSCPSCAQDRLERQLAEKDEALRLADRLMEARAAEANYPGCTEGEVGDEEHARISAEADELEAAYEDAREALRAEPAKGEA